MQFVHYLVLCYDSLNKHYNSVLVLPFLGDWPVLRLKKLKTPLPKRRSQLTNFDLSFILG